MIPATRSAAALALLGTAAVLSAALALEHLAGAVPCHLCLVQRYPYYAALPILAGALAVPGVRGPRVLLGIAATLFATSTLLAGHHSLVELGLLPAPTGCAASTLPMPGSVEAFNAQLRGVRVAACDRVGFRLAGLSLANWNLLASPVLALACLLPAFPAGRRLLARIAPA